MRPRAFIGNSGKGALRRRRVSEQRGDVFQHSIISNLAKQITTLVVSDEFEPELRLGMQGWMPFACKAFLHQPDHSHGRRAAIAPSADRPEVLPHRRNR